MDAMHSVILIVGVWILLVIGFVVTERTIREEADRIIEEIRKLKIDG
jgi:hypothetical protein